MDQRPALVQELGREGDPELDGEHGDAALAPPVGPVPLRDGLATLLEPSKFNPVRPDCGISGSLEIMLAAF